jgi:preprotein translocase subunit YajC
VQKASEHVEAGDRVTHDRRGCGTVVRVVDDHDVIVDFGETGTLITVSHLKLTKL